MVVQFKEKKRRMLYKRALQTFPKKNFSSIEYFSVSLKVDSIIKRSFSGNRDEEKFKTSGNKERFNLMKKIERLCSWNSTSELVDELYKSIIYHEPVKDNSGLIVLNKPYGLALNTAKDSSYCLVGCLKALADKLNVEKIEVVKCTERFSSGITILGTTNKTKKEYYRSKARWVTNRSLACSYLAIVKGQPNYFKTEHLGKRITECPKVNNPLFGSMHKEPVLFRGPISSRRKRDNIKTVHISSHSLTRSPHGVGLVVVSPSGTGNHLIPLYLSDLGHPVLGDQLYDYRSREILGQKVKLTTSHTNAKRTQVLSSNLLELLNLNKGEEWKLPKMIHFHRLFLPSWFDKGKDLTIYAPPPDHWIDTCELLGLKLDYKDIAQKDCVMQWPLKKTKVVTNELNAPSGTTDLMYNITKLSQ